MTSRILKMLAIAAICSLGFTQSANATILTFNGLTVGSPVPQAYGDNVTSTTSGGFSYGVGAEGFTPDITVSYAIRSALGSNAGANVPNVVSDPTNLPSFNEYVNATTTDPVLEITFTPTATATVRLIDFLVGRNATGTVGGRQFGVYNSSYSALLGPTNYSNPGAVGDTVSVAVNYTGAVGQTLVFQIKLTDVLGINDFSFSQVPEPSGIAMAGVMGMALAGMAWMKRRRNKTLVVATSANDNQPPTA